MRINLIKELKLDNYTSYNAPSADNIVLVVVKGAVSVSVYDEVWDKVRSPCFDFYLDSDIPWALARVLKGYEY